MAAGGLVIRLAVALACVGLVGCGGLPEPAAPAPPPSSTAPPGPSVEELRPKAAAAITTAAQPLGPATTADKDEDPGSPGFSTTTNYCKTIIGFNIQGTGRPGAIVSILGQLALTMTVGNASEKSPGLRVEAQVVRRARSLDETPPDNSCPGQHILNVQQQLGTYGAFTTPAVGVQRPQSVVVSGRKADVVRTTVGVRDGSYLFLPGQVHLVLIAEPWYLDIAVLQARRAAPAEATTLTDEAQQVAVSLAERLLRELPP